MMPSVFIATRNLGAGIDIAYLTQAASALIALVLLYRALRSTQDHDLRIALTAAATFLITPYAFNYDLPLLTAALFVGGLVVVAARFDRPTRLVYGLVWLLPILVLPANTLGIPLGPLLLWALFVQLTRLAASATDRPAAHARLSGARPLRTARVDARLRRPNRLRRSLRPSAAHPPATPPPASASERRHPAADRRSPTRTLTDRRLPTYHCDANDAAGATASLVDPHLAGPTAAPPTTAPCATNSSPTANTITTWLSPTSRDDPTRPILQLDLTPRSPPE